MKPHIAGCRVTFSDPTSYLNALESTPTTPLSAPVPGQAFEAVLEEPGTDPMPFVPEAKGQESQNRNYRALSAYP